uniref:Uncharacterized protein n=1 Tax=Romanomermis culicivorax TaxID=13658 RepID=A0A915L3N9_ROMCU
MLTTEELLNRPTSAINVEPADKEPLDTLIFDLNIAKLPPSTDVSALPMPTATAHLRATATQITNFLKLTLNEISTLTAVPMDKSTPVQPTAMDAKTNTTMDQMLTDIPKESTEEIQCILLPQPTPAVTVPQVAQTARVIAQAAVQ